MQPGDVSALWGMVDQSQQITENVLSVVTPEVLAAGNALWRGLAAIVIVWTGIQMALSGGPLNVGQAVRMVLAVSIPLGMLQFYTTPLPGTGGMTVPQLIVGMGRFINQIVVADAGQQMGEEVFGAFGSFALRLGEGGFLGENGVSWTSMLTGLPGLLDAAFDLVVTVGVMLLLGVGMLFVWALGQAQVMWSQIALSMALMLGPIFIPWIMVPPLAWLFWGWFRTVLIYSLYAAVASTVFRVMTELGVGVVRAWTESVTADGVDWTGATGLLGAAAQTMVTVPYIVGAGLAASKVGELTQLLVLGGGNLGSGAGQAMRALRTMRGG